MLSRTIVSRSLRPFALKYSRPSIVAVPYKTFHSTIVQAEKSKTGKHVSDISKTNENDHRAIGKAQDLFMIHPVSPGSIFMLPHGTRIVQRLQDFLRREYKRYGYDEVMTPLIYKKDLWETSGHWQNYKEDMFMVSSGKEEHHSGCCGGAHGDTSDGGADADEGLYGLKPMNCPGHCLIFDSVQRSYRDLPIRLADFSPLHRNEVSGALSGLTRVRRFHQDDAHIFCTKDQIVTEISSCLSFVDRVYKAFDFPHFDFTLSTRPDNNYIGSVTEWDNAEDALKKALDTTGRPWTVKEGDGAFYGPKIDIMVKDSLGKSHQTATIQLDFQLPQRFKLKYVDEHDQAQTPVIVHRAILGSIERMLAILIEHTNGKWPFWLSPRQAVILPVATPFADYATQVAKSLSGSGDENNTDESFYVDADTSSRDRLNKMIRQAQQQRYNFIGVVGQKEMDTGTVNVRTRSGEILGSMTVEELRSMFSKLNADLK